MDAHEPLTCPLEGDEISPCEGEVTYWLIGTRSHARCEKHGEHMLDAYENTHAYFTAAPPAWFDPAYAGEHWDSDY